MRQEKLNLEIVNARLIKQMDQDKQHIERLQIINDEQSIAIYNLQT